MAGHSKFSKIKHKKANNDQEKCMKASKILQQIRNAVLQKVEQSKIDNLILTAKSMNISKESINRALEITQSANNLLFEMILNKKYQAMIYINEINKDIFKEKLKKIEKKFQIVQGNCKYNFENNIPIQTIETSEEFEDTLNSLQEHLGMYIEEIYTNVA